MFSKPKFRSDSIHKHEILAVHFLFNKIYLKENLEENGIKLKKYELNCSCIHTIQDGLIN